MAKSKPIYSERSLSLMKKAAQEFGRGGSPFDAGWLGENNVVFSEALWLSDIVGTILEGFARSAPAAQLAIIICSALEDTDDPNKAISILNAAIQSARVTEMDLAIQRLKDFDYSKIKSAPKKGS